MRLTLAVLVVAAATYLGANAKSLLQQEPAARQVRGRGGNPAAGVPVVTAPVRKADLGVYIGALGTVTPVYTVTLTSRVPGEIIRVAYEEGQLVHKGDPLLDIDPRPYDVQLAQAEGQYDHDAAVLSEARIDLERYRAAFERNAIAKQQLDDQEQVVKQDEGTVKNDQAQIDNAKLQLVYCHIAAPIDGRVGLRLVDPGNMLQTNSSTPLVVITQLEPITVVFSVAEDYLQQIQQQLKKGHRLTVDALDRLQQTQVAAGSLLTLDNQIDTTTGTVKLKAIFDNHDNALFPNQFVNARLLVDTQKGTTAVPSAAIQRNAQGTFVYVIRPDRTASMRTVSAGTADGDLVAVQGVNPGDVVAVNGFDKLQDGVKVAAADGGSDGGQARAVAENRR
jgi:membrane fusion protein, multidrug efflux system